MFYCLNCNNVLKYFVLSLELNVSNFKFYSIKNNENSHFEITRFVTIVDTFSYD